MGVSMQRDVTTFIGYYLIVPMFPWAPLLLQKLYEMVRTNVQLLTAKILKIYMDDIMRIETCFSVIYKDSPNDNTDIQGHSIVCLVFFGCHPEIHIKVRVPGDNAFQNEMLIRYSQNK